MEVKFTDESTPTFRNLMIRCLNHEFDSRVSGEHITYLRSDIWEAFSQMDITEVERNRLIIQWNLLSDTALVQIQEGTRSNSLGFSV